MPIVMLIIAFAMPLLPVSSANFCKAAIYKNARTCYSLPPPSERAMCSAIMGGDDTTTCHALTNLQSEQFCDAVTLRDDPACQALEEANVRLVCHALISHNSAYCHDNGDADAKSFCTALTTNDVATCDTIENADSKSFCHAYLKNDPALCPAKNTASTAGVTIKKKGPRGWRDPFLGYERAG